MMRHHSTDIGRHGNVILFLMAVFKQNTIS